MEHTKNIVYHVEVVKGPFSVSLGKIEIEGNRAYIISLPFQIWLLTEWISYLIVQYIVRREKENFDLVNFHIAYPLCAYIHKLKKSINTPIVITEHWSAYHFNFGLPREKKLKRIKRIFAHSIPIITVSQSLASDIRNFSGVNIDSFVVPNIVDDSIFFPNEAISRQDFFFMVSLWKWPKRPLVVLEAFKQFISRYPHYKLKIGGYGPEYKQMQLWIAENKLGQHVELVGALNSYQIAEYLQACRAFIHCTEYETFSVVCAEALSCRTPVLASKVGGVPEIVDEKSGILVDSFCSEVWAEAMVAIIENDFIGTSPNLYTKESISKQYLAVLNSVIQKK